MHNKPANASSVEMPGIREPPFLFLKLYRRTLQALHLPNRALVQIRGGPDSGRFARFDWDGSDYAVRAACQISGILAVRPASLPILN